MASSVSVKIFTTRDHIQNEMFSSWHISNFHIIPYLYFLKQLPKLYRISCKTQILIEVNLEKMISCKDTYAYWIKNQYVLVIMYLKIVKHK